MSTQPDTIQTIAFLGATGETACFCLAATLRAHIPCRALARTPSKLTASLTAKSIPQHLQEKYLTIIPGNAKDILAMQQLLTLPDGSGVVDKIVSGIGAKPKLQISLRRPVILTEPWIVRDVIATLLSALKVINPPPPAAAEAAATGKKPILINVSTTGIPPSNAPSDIPRVYGPLYHWLLAEPHEDKRAMEEGLAAHMKLPQEERVLEAFVNVKPALLMDGEGKGVQAVRVGTEKEPAVGYWVRRRDVGEWMAESLVVGTGVKDEWRNLGVTVTYEFGRAGVHFEVF